MTERKAETRAKMFAKMLAAGTPSREDYMPNREYASQQWFVDLCEKAGVKATPRQASKYRRQMGSAFAAK